MILKLLSALMLSLFMSVVQSCTGDVDAVITDNTETFKVSDYDIWVTTPSGWTNSESESFDLQCASPRQDVYLSTFGFSQEDLSEEQSLEDFFEFRLDALLSELDYVSEIEPVSILDFENKSIYSALYSGEFEGYKYYYNIFLISFNNTDDIAWIVFNGIPSTMENSSDTIKYIITNIESRDPGDGETDDDIPSDPELFMADARHRYTQKTGKSSR